MWYCRGKFLGRIYLHSICKRKSGAIQKLENLREKPAKIKNHSTEGGSTKSKRLYGVLSTLLQIEFSRVFCNNQKPTPFSIEKDMYLYLPELSSRVRIFWIHITAWFARCDLHVAAQIAPLDYWGHHAEIFATIYSSPLTEGGFNV